MAAKKVTVEPVNQVHRGVGTGNTAHYKAFATTDATEGGYFENTGTEILLFLPGAADREVTFYDVNGRSVGKIKLKESAVAAFGPFDVGQYGSKVSFKTSHEAATAAAIQLTNPKTIQIPT